MISITVGMQVHFVNEGNVFENVDLPLQYLEWVLFFAKGKRTTRRHMVMRRRHNDW